MTLASKITVTRIFLIPVFAGLAISYGRTVAAGQPAETLRWWALAVFVIASASDGIDGWIARHFNQQSKFGAFIDPLADKALLLTGVLTLSLVDWGTAGWRLPLWFAAVVATRDLIIVGGLLILKSSKRRISISPHWTGKICTVTQMFALGWVMLRVELFPPLWPCLLAALFSVWSALAYIRQGQAILRQPREP